MSNMKTFRVYYTVTEEDYLMVEAENDDLAYELARDELRFRGDYIDIIDVEEV